MCVCVSHVAWNVLACWLPLRALVCKDSVQGLGLDPYGTLALRGSLQARDNLQPRSMPHSPDF